MTGWKRRVLFGSLYGLLFLVSTFVFLLLAFPWDRAARYLEVALAKRSDMDVRVGAVSPTWTLGLELTDVTLRSRSPDSQGRFRTFQADRVRIEPSFSTLFGGDLDVAFTAETMGGIVEGDFYRAAQDTRVVAHLRGLLPNEVSTVRDIVGQPLEGRLDGTLDVTLRGHKFSQASGSLDVVGRDVVVGDGKTPMRLKLRPQDRGQFAELQEFLEREDQGVVLPPMDVGAFNLKVRITRGVARVTQMGARSKHLEFRGEGTIDLKDPLSLSEVRIYVLYRFTDEYKNIDSETRSAIDSMTRSPNYQRALRSDGFWGFRMQGTFRDRIRSFPARSGFSEDEPPPLPPPDAPLPEDGVPVAPPPTVVGLPPKEGALPLPLPRPVA